LGRPKIDEATEAAIAEALKVGGTGIRKLAELHGVGTGTVQRISQALKQSEANA
jgi:transposase